MGFGRPCVTRGSTLSCYKRVCVRHTLDPISRDPTGTLSNVPLFVSRVTLRVTGHSCHPWCTSSDNPDSSVGRGGYPLCRRGSLTRHALLSLTRLPLRLPHPSGDLLLSTSGPNSVNRRILSSIDVPPTRRGWSDRKGLPFLVTG